MYNLNTKMYKNDCRYTFRSCKVNVFAIICICVLYGLYLLNLLTTPAVLFTAWNSTLTIQEQTDQTSSFTQFETKITQELEKKLGYIETKITENLEKKLDQVETKITENLERKLGQVETKTTQILEKKPEVQKVEEKLSQDEIKLHEPEKEIENVTVAVEPIAQVKTTNKELNENNASTIVDYQIKNEGKKYAYVYYGTEINYICSVLLNMNRIRELGYVM